MSTPERWYMVYADQNEGCAYVVTTDPHPPRQRRWPDEDRLKFDEKPEAIAEAQRRNGWPVDGREATFAEQTKAADERRLVPRLAARFSHKT